MTGRAGLGSGSLRLDRRGLACSRFHATVNGFLDARRRGMWIAGDVDPLLGGG